MGANFDASAKASRAISPKSAIKDLKAAGTESAVALNTLEGSTVV